MTTPGERGSRWPLAIVATASIAISFFDRQTLSVLAPRVTKALEISDRGYGLLGAAFAAAYVVGSPIAGRIVDRVGARRALLGAVVAWSVVSATHALSTGFATLLLMRVALGFTEAPSFPGAIQVMRRALTERDRTRGVAAVVVGISIGSLLAPPIATFLALRYDWRAAFLGTAAIGLLWVPIWLTMAFRSPARELLDAPDEGRHREPVIRHTAVKQALVALFSVAPMAAFGTMWEAKFFADHLHVPEGARAGYLLVGPIAFDLGSILFGEAATRLGSRRGPFAIAATLATSGALALAFAPTAPIAALCILVGNAGRGALVALFNAEMVVRVPARIVSSAAGLVAAAQGLTYGVTTALIGQALTRVGYPGVLIALACWTVPGCVAWLLWRRSQDATL